MRGGPLRALTRPRLTRSWLRRHNSGCRFGAVAITRQHIHTVKLATDNPDPLPRPPQHVAAARSIWCSWPTPGVRSSPFGAHTMHAVCAELDVELPCTQEM